MSKTSNIFVRDNTPLSYESLTKEQFDYENEKGIADMNDGRIHSIDSVAEEMKRDYGI